MSASSRTFGRVVDRPRRDAARMLTSQTQRVWHEHTARNPKGSQGRPPIKIGTFHQSVMHTLSRDYIVIVPDRPAHCVLLTYCVDARTIAWFERDCGSGGSIFHLPARVSNASKASTGLPHPSAHPPPAYRAPSGEKAAAR